MKKVFTVCFLMLVLCAVLTASFAAATSEEEEEAAALGKEDRRQAEIPEHLKERLEEARARAEMKEKIDTAETGLGKLFGRWSKKIGKKLEGYTNNMANQARENAAKIKNVGGGEDPAPDADSHPIDEL